jgi:hypothetical protein
MDLAAQPGGSTAARPHRGSGALDADCTDGGAAGWRQLPRVLPHELPARRCTNPGGAAQPAPAPCSAPECIGDDTVHAVCPRAYTWPNDPQT